MKNTESIKTYSVLEEHINSISHAFGLLLSVVALVFLVIHVSLHGNVWHIVSFTVFGVSLIVLYTASTCYHLSKKAEAKRRLRTFDHAAIYVLIAGTYTPFTLVTLHGPVGWVLFGVSWGLALAGIMLKLFFTGRYKVLSTLMYIGMGWLIIFAIKPLFYSLPLPGLIWLFAGGMAYTIGAVLYSIHKIKLNHAIFHILVLIGSACQFISIYCYVLV